MMHHHLPRTLFGRLSRLSLKAAQVQPSAWSKCSTWNGQHPRWPSCLEGEKGQKPSKKKNVIGMIIHILFITTLFTHQYHNLWPNIMFDCGWFRIDKRNAWIFIWGKSPDSKIHRSPKTTSTSAGIGWGPWRWPFGSFSLQLWWFQQT